MKHIKKLFLVFWKHVIRIHEFILLVNVRTHYNIRKLSYLPKIQSMLLHGMNFVHEEVVDNFEVLCGSPCSSKIHLLEIYTFSLIFEK